MRALLFILLLASCGGRPVGSEVKLKFRGLYSHPNLLTLPEGAAVQADNVVNRREDIIEPRRGVAAYGDAQAALRIFPYAGGLLALTSTTLRYYNAGTWTALTGSFSQPDATTAKMRSTEALQNFYFTTSAGVYRKSTLADAPAVAGAIKCAGFERDGRVYTSSAGNMSLTTNVVSVTTTAAHGFYVGQVITQTSATEAPYAAGNYTVSTVPTSTSFTYALVAGDDAANANPHTFGPATLNTAGGFLTDQKQVAYRAVFNCPDTNNTQKLGAVSPRIVIANASGTNGWVTAEAKNTIVRVFVPSTALVTHRVQLYRSAQVATTVEPSDEMGLVWEALIKQGDITNGYVDIPDITPDELRGATLYASPSQEGVLQSNEPPPLAKDIVLFKDQVLYANTTSRHRIVLTLLGVSAGTGGLQNGDVITIDNGIYTAKTTPTSSTHFKVDTTAGSVGVRNTAMSLVACVNRDTSNNSGAYYVSSADALPGAILFERKTLGGSSWTPYLYGNGATIGIRSGWNPLLNPLGQGVDLSRTSNVVTATILLGATHNFLVGERVTLASPSGTFGAGPHTITAVNAAKTTFTYSETAANDTLLAVEFGATTLLTTSAEATPNRVYRSKAGQPEAVPELNYFDLGSKDADLLRLVALRDSVFAFKEDGVYRSGDGANWDLFDPTIILLAPDSAVTLGNQIYAWTSQGVVAISDTGSEIVSRPIEKTLTELRALSASGTRNITFAVSYESEHEYELRTITAANDTAATRAFIYNTVTQTWVRDSLTSKCGLVNPADDKRYLGGSTSVLQERKAYTYADASDADLAVTISSVTSTTATLVSATGVSVGDVLTQSGADSNMVTSVDGNVLTLESPLNGFTAAAATVKTGISSTVKWAPITGGAPDRLKLFRETLFLLGNATVRLATVTFDTEFDTAAVSVDVDAVSDQWDGATEPWSGAVTPFNLRLLVPQSTRRGSRLGLKWALAQAWGHWNISGLVIRFEDSGERSIR